MSSVKAERFRLIKNQPLTKAQDPTLSDCFSRSIVGQVQPNNDNRPVDSPLETALKKKTELTERT
jgi:hypothetical protein